MTTVAGFELGGATEPWQALGLTVRDGATWVAGTALTWPTPGSAGGILGWTLSGAPSAGDVDGLATSHVGEVEVEAWAHPLGVVGFDHVVVMTSSLERTCAALATATGAELKRVREAGTGPDAVRQGFHRLGGLIVEVVESPRVRAPQATFWGLVLTVADLDGAIAWLGPDVVGPAKDAVQRGRRIATVRAGAGLGVPVALMSS